MTRRNSTSNPSCYEIINRTLQQPRETRIDDLDTDYF
ncbi:unnamed protein product [Tenebrio molitor]|nr:unnamed protein product [Tenebrio molitor]